MQQVPASFYGGMDFKIDTSAYTNFMLKRQAQEQAREAALDKYYKGLTANATPTGMREQEVKAFEAAMTDYKLFYTENSSKIASGNYPELALEAEKKSRVPFEIAAQSKNNYARDKTIATIRGANKKQADLWTEGSWAAYNKSTAPQYLPNPSGRGVILNPEYADFDPMAIQTHPEEVNLDKQLNETTKDVERATEYYDQPDKIDRFTTERIKKTTPTETGLAKVAQRADFQWDDATEYTFKKKKMYARYKDHPEQFDELFKSYQKVFPNKTEFKDDKDMYIAMAINLADKDEIIPTERIVNTTAKDAYNREQNLIFDKKLKLFEQSLKPTEKQNLTNAVTYFEAIPNGVYTTTKGQKVEKKGDVWVDANGKPLTTSGDNVVKITANIPDGFAKNAPGKASVAVDYMDLHVNNGIASGAYNDLTKFVPRSSAIKQAYKGTGVKAPIQQINTQPEATNLGF